MNFIIGDSHVSAFVINDNTNFMIKDLSPSYKNNYCVIRTFPYTCYNLENKQNILDMCLKKMNINTDNDFLYFCYRETDIR